MILLGLVGFIGSGKGTAGDLLEKMGFAKQSFAGPVKDAVAAMFAWDRALLEGDTKESRDWREQPDYFWSNIMGRSFTPREALQKMGTEVGREIFHPDVWVQTLKKRLTGDTVITDVRFQNEMDFIRNNKGYIIHVKRGKLPDWYEVAARANGGNLQALEDMKEYGIHPSEWKWIGGKVDWTIENDSSIVALAYNLEAILHYIKYDEQEGK